MDTTSKKKGPSSPLKIKPNKKKRQEKSDTSEPCTSNAKEYVLYDIFYIV